MRGTMHKLPDAVEAAPDIYRILLENERTRVFNILLKPGDKVEMHSHPDHVVYVLSDQFVRFTSEDGKIKEVRLRAGQAFFFPAGPHMAENIGNTDARNIIVELKG